MRYTLEEIALGGWRPVKGVAPFTSIAEAEKALRRRVWRQGLGFRVVGERGETKLQARIVIDLLNVG